MRKGSGEHSVIANPRSLPFVVAIIFILVFGAASLIAYQHHISTLRHTVNENKSTANILSNLIYEHQKAAIGILESYASRPSFVDAIQKKDFDQAIIRLKSLSEHHTEIDAPFITDQYGTLWANYPVDRNGYGKNLAHRDWYKGVSRSWRPYISSAYRLIVLEKGLAVAVSVPVFDRKDNIIGVLSNAQRTTFLTRLIKANKLDPKNNITLLDQEGNIIYSDTIEYEKEITKCPQFSLIQKTIGDGKNTLEIPDHLKEGKEEILAFSPIKNIGWTIIVGEEKGAILKSETGDFIKIFTIAFLLFMCMAMVPLFLQREFRYRKTKELLEKERQLRESEDKYRNIFENAVEGIFQTTPEGRFIIVNPAMAHMHGFASPEEMITGITDVGKQLYVNPEDRVRYRTILEEKGEANNFEAQVYRNDGNTVWSSTNARAVRDAAGSISCFEGTTEDITPRKLAEESLRQTLEKLRKSLAGTIQALSSTVETRDPYTAGHQRKVSNLARTIAQEMGLSSDTVDTIRMAGIIHDIGKISVPAEILSKPGKLPDIEMSLIKVHSQSGYDILKDVGLPYPIAEMVLQHHERLDGSGYPQGLKGDQILLETKILSVADVVEAIATHRPYRPALGIDAALEEIEKNKGILYDEKVVDVCLRLFREKGFTFESTES
jgi:PAS domain S-box-containing protein/putative nucleotidyltransferase with HDIG domain